MRINHNIPALIANNQLAATNNNLAKSLQKLSSGKRINKAADDAAGLAISQKMDTQVRGLTQATRNANDGISVIQTAEGALNEVHSMLQRMRELAVQVSNGTYDEVDRASVQDEINQLNEEIQRISDTTEFNERKLLNGEIDRRSYSTTKNLNIVSLSDGVNPADYGLTVTQDARQAVLVGDAIDKTSITGLLDSNNLVTEKASGTININGEEVKIEAGDTADDVYDKLRELCERVNVDVFTISDKTIDPATADVNAGYQAETFAFDESKMLVFCSKEYGSDQKVEVYCDSTELKTLLGITNGRATGVDVLKTLIIKWSPRTYLGIGYNVKEPESFHCSFGAQAGMLSRRIYKEHGIDLKKLEILKDVYLVCIGKEEAVSHINEEQLRLIESIGVKLES